MIMFFKKRVVDDTPTAYQVYQEMGKNLIEKAKALRSLTDEEFNTNYVEIMKTIGPLSTDTQCIYRCEANRRCDLKHQEEIKNLSNLSDHDLLVGILTCLKNSAYYGK
jgi:hypothetical protein